MTPENELNHTMLKKYINKHYKIYKINPIWPISKKLSHRVDFTLFDLEAQEEKTQWHVDKYLCKIFSVDAMAVKLALDELVKEEIERLKRQQINLFETDNNKIS